jgi:glucose/arabinose dehydrogenase
MNSKIILGLVAIIFLLVGILPLVFKRQVGDIRPAILPPKEISIPNSGDASISAGSPLNLPLKVSGDLNIGIFAKDLGAPRDLEFSPGGVLLASIPSEGKVVALPDKNNDGVADQVKEILVNLNKPHGLAFFENKLYVAEETRVAVYDWNEINLQPSNSAELFKLPAGGRHFSRTITFNSKGQLFVSIGSTCDVCIEKNGRLGTVVVYDSKDGSSRVFAFGLRNAVFITINPKTDEIWGTEMGRDFLGDNLPPDEINIIEDGQDYGWPFCYGNKIADTKFTEDRPQGRVECPKTTPALFEIPAHSAPLGLTFITSKQFPNEWQEDLLVAYHGSWNSTKPVGYKVVRMNVEGDKITSEEDFITGFLDGSEAIARPVDLIFDKAGSLYLSDDKAGYIFKIIKSQ